MLTVFLLSIFVQAILVDRASATILSAYVVPHGGIALDPSHFNTSDPIAKQQAQQIHHAYVTVATEIAAKEPGLVVLSTPHGVADTKNFLFYLNSVGEGFADTDNCQCPPCCYKASATIDYRLAEDVLKFLGAGDADRNVSGVSSYGPPGTTEPFPLRWGEVIPLHFLGQMNHSRTMIISHPTRRYTEVVQMIPELLQLGGDLYSILDRLNEWVVVVISGDLAHTHMADGPYGYSNASKPFDEACGHWAETLDPKSLLETAAQYSDKALSCGYSGLVMLHGMLAQGKLSSWTSELLVNYHPSYYGMMVASFHRRGDSFKDPQ